MYLPFHHPPTVTPALDMLNYPIQLLKHNVFHFEGRKVGKSREGLGMMRWIDSEKASWKRLHSSWVLKVVELIILAKA